ncbi:Transposase IS4, partial [Phytophthora infestans]
DPGSHIRPRRPLLLWPQSLVLGGNKPIDNFYLMYPMATLRDTLLRTNFNMQGKRYRCIKQGDWFTWIEIRLAMAYEPRRGPLPIYGEIDIKEGSVGTPANYGQRFGMSRHCFEQTLGCMSFDNADIADDPWSPIRPIVDGFNSRRLHVVSSGSLLCIDESMRAWKVREGKYCHDGVPHKTKTIRKPEGLRVELKALADGDTGIMLRLELMEGATRQRAKPYNAEYGKGTAVVLRLSEPYRGSGRTIVPTLESRMGMVKTETVGYSMIYLQSWFAKKKTVRGSCKVLSSTTDMGTQMYAVGWADRKAKTIITNRGTTLPHTNSVRPHHRLVERNGVIETLRYEKQIEQPQMIEHHRLFSTLLGTVVVAAYKAYCHDTTDGNHQDNPVLEFQDFVSQLAHQLIFNDYIAPRVTRSFVGDTAQQNERQCGVCKQKASFYYVECSDPHQNVLFEICGPKTEILAAVLVLAIAAAHLFRSIIDLANLKSAHPRVF